MSSVNPATIKRLKENSLGLTAYAHVDLSSSFVTSHDLDTIATAILKNMTKNPELICPIVSINLTGNQICGVTSLGYGQYDYKGLQALSNCLVNNNKQCRIKKIIFFRNNIGQKGFQLVGDIMAALALLTDVNLRDCGGDPHSMRKLGEAIEKSKGIANLDIAQNRIGSEGMIFLKKSLQVTRTIKSLNLSLCSLGPAGMSVLCEALKLNTSIQLIRLADNQLGDEGVATLAATLPFNLSLLHIDLQENRITNVGAEALAVGLARNRSVVCIALQWNEITVEAVPALVEGISNSNSMKALFILGNRIDPENAGFLAACKSPPLELDVSFIANVPPPKPAAVPEPPAAPVESEPAGGATTEP